MALTLTTLCRWKRKEHGEGSGRDSEVILCTPTLNYKSSEDTVFSFGGRLGSGEQMDIHEGKGSC